METTFDYLRRFGPLLAERILETYPPLQSTKDAVAPSLGALLRKALPAQALAITGTAKYLRRAKSARIVAECGAGKTFVALRTIPRSCRRSAQRNAQVAAARRISRTSGPEGPADRPSLARLPHRGHA